MHGFKVYAAESNCHSQTLLYTFITENDLSKIVEVVDSDLEKLAEKSFNDKVLHSKSTRLCKICDSCVVFIVCRWTF